MAILSHLRDLLRPQWALVSVVERQVQADGRRGKRDLVKGMHLDPYYVFTLEQSAGGRRRVRTEVVYSMMSDRQARLDPAYEGIREWQRGGSLPDVAITRSLDVWVIGSRAGSWC